MTKVCEAVYENGVFKPVGTEPVLKEGQRVKIVREEIATEKDHADPAIWFREFKAARSEMFDDMSETEIAEMKAAMLDRDHFFEAPRNSIFEGGESDGTNR